MYKTGHDLTDEEIRRRYSRIAKDVSMPRYFYDYVASTCAPATASGRLLDIGCGNGYLLGRIAAHCPELGLQGVEPAPGLAANSRVRAAGRWTVYEASATDLPFEDGSMDYVTMTEVFEHMKDPVAVLRETMRVLAPGGSLTMTVPNMSAYAPFWRAAERLPLGPARRAFLPWEHPLKTFQPIDTAYEFEEILEVIGRSDVRVQAIEAREFLPYLTTTIPFARRAYARYGQQPVDRMLSRVLPARMGYRLVIKAQKPASIAA